MMLLRSRNCAFVLVLLLVGKLSAAPALPAVAASIANDKLTDALLIKQRFTNATVQVIVCLTPPAPLAQANFASDVSLAAARPHVKKAQQDVLDAMPVGEVKAGHRFDNIAGFVADVTPAGLKALQAHAQVVSIEPVIELQPHLAQGIPLIGGMTYRSTYNGAGLAIAICDTGVDYTHSKLGGGGFPNTKVIGGYDYGDNDANPMPDSTQAHGTCCAGIAAGDLGTVGDYIGGVAYNAKIYALKITSGTSGSASSAAMASAWDWCVTHRNDDPNNPIMVISTSFGGGQYFSTCDSTTPSMTTAANNAVTAGITVFASSGNDGYCDSMGWPACISSVISVGAVYDANFGTYLPCVSSASCAAKTADTGCSSGYYATDATAADKVTSYANVASFLTLFAPGNDCYTLDIAGSGGYSTGDYDANFGGTSAACPYAAGAAACLQSAAKAITGSYLSVAEVKSRLLSTGVSIADTKVAITKPRINLAAAIQTLNTNPVVNYVSTTLSGGNGNQLVDPNECDTLSIVVRNSGVSTASNITAALSTTTPGVSVLQPTSAYPNLATNATAANLTAFKISTAPGFVCGTPVSLTLVVNFIGGSTTNTFSLPSGNATNYVMTTATGGSIVPGSTDIGNHGDDTTTAVTLPFAYTFYGQSFGAVRVDSNGNLQFTSTASSYNNTCPPATAVTNAILALWDDLRTDGTNTILGPQGIYTSTTGVAPDRIFNIEWRASLYDANGGGSLVNFEVRLYESQSRFDILYGTLAGNGATATVGAQKDTGSTYIQYSCNTAAVSNGLQLTFQMGCADGGGVCNDTNVAAAFIGAPTAGLAPLAVTFINTSANATNYTWDFGDGKTSALTSPTNTYTNAGSYTVTLTAVGATGTNVLARTNYIVATNVPPPTAAFTGTPTNGLAPLTVGFANTSTFATNYAWNFGDGKTSALTSPTNTYTNAGSYTVTLTAVGASGTNILTRTNYITATTAAPAVTAPPQNVITNLGSNATFSVTATGSPAPTYQWRFNGTNISGATAPSYTLAGVQLTNIGLYSVVVSNIAGSVTSAPANLLVIVSPGVISVSGAPFAENFDSMGSAGTTTPFGWYVGTGTAAISGTTVTAGTGSSSSGGNYNFGSSGASDRALGSLASGSTVRETEARFINVSGLLISALTICYTGEQWRVGGTGAVNNTLVLQYSTDGVNFTALGAAFDFNTPLDAAAAGALDGNQATNRVTGIGGTFTPASAITNNQIFYLRWMDAKETSSNHGIAVDDLAITFTLTNPPPPVLNVTPASLDFARLAPGGSAQAAFVISNAGGSPLTGTASGWTTPFSTTNSAAFNLAAAAATNFVFVFAPGTEGIFSNRIAFVSNGGNSTNPVTGQSLGALPLGGFSWSGAGFGFSFNSVAGFGYEVQYKDALSDTNWQLWQTFTGSGLPVTITNLPTNGVQRFFRLRVP